MANYLHVLFTPTTLSVARRSQTSTQGPTFDSLTNLSVFEEENMHSAVSELRGGHLERVIPGCNRRGAKCGPCFSVATPLSSLGGDIWIPLPA